MTTHSAICGPWTPLQLVKAISCDSVNSGLVRMRSTPALKRWISLTLGHSSPELGSTEPVKRMVLSL